MPLNDAFEHNGLTIESTEAPPSMGAIGPNVVAYVVTAPNKADDIGYSMPFRCANFTDAAQLDVTGDELGTGYHAAYHTLRKTQVAIYFIVVPEGVNEADTTANIVGGVDADGVRTGIEALTGMTERPTIIAAPGYSHKKSVIDALTVMGRRLGARVVVDGPSEGKQAAIDLSNQLGGNDSGHERVMMVDTDPLVYSRAAKGDIYIPPSIIGTAALASVEQWESPGNQGVLINGTSRVVDYNILDKSTEGNLLNKYGISYFARTSLGGFSLIGNRTVTGNFISHIGLADAMARKIELSAQRAMAENLTKAFMEQEVRKLHLWGQTLVASEVIPGCNVYLHPERNTIETYKNGTWFIVMDYGRYSPNEHMIIQLNASDGITEAWLEEVL